MVGFTIGAILFVTESGGVERVIEDRGGRESSILKLPAHVLPYQVGFRKQEALSCY